MWLKTPYRISHQQVEQVFAVDSVEGAIDNLRGRREPWAQMALQNIGEPCAGTPIRDGSTVPSCYKALTPGVKAYKGLIQTSGACTATESPHVFACFRFTCQNVAERSSPLSLKVIFEQVKRGGGMSLKESLDDEFFVNAHLFGLPDFEMAMQAREAGVRLRKKTICKPLRQRQFITISYAVVKLVRDRTIHHTSYAVQTPPQNCSHS